MEITDNTRSIIAQSLRKLKMTQTELKSRTKRFALATLALSDKLPNNSGAGQIFNFE